MGVFSMGNVSEANRMQATLKDSDGAIPVGRGMYESMQNTITAIQTWWSGGQEDLTRLVADVQVQWSCFCHVRILPVVGWWMGWG